MIRTPLIGELSREYGVEKVEAYLKIWLIELNQIINAKRHLTEPQIDETAYQIVSNFRNLSIADINIIFQKAKLGGYGSLYETLSIDKIASWFTDYFNERCNVAGDMTRHDHDKIKYQNEKGDKRGSKGEFREKMREAVHDYNLNNYKKKHNVKDNKNK